MAKIDYQLYSNCCGKEIKNTDYDLCLDCGEHCDFVAYDDEGNEVELDERGNPIEHDDQPLIDDQIRRDTDKMFGRTSWGAKV